MIGRMFKNIIKQFSFTETAYDCDVFKKGDEVRSMCLDGESWLIVTGTVKAVSNDGNDLIISLHHSKIIGGYRRWHVCTNAYLTQHVG